MQRLEVSGAVRPIYGSLGVKGLRNGGTVVGVVSGLRFWTIRGSNSDMGKGFIVYPKCLDRFRGRFPRDKADGA